MTVTEAAAPKEITMDATNGQSWSSTPITAHTANTAIAVR